MAWTFLRGANGVHRLGVEADVRGGERGAGGEGRALDPASRHNGLAGEAQAFLVRCTAARDFLEMKRPRRRGERADGASPNRVR